MYEDLKANYPDYLPIHTAMLTSLESPESRRYVPQDDQLEASIKFANQIIAVADTVIASVDQEKLLAYYGLKNDQRPDASKVKVNMDKQKSCLIESLVKKGSALSRIYVYNKKKSADSAGNQQVLEQIGEVWKDVLKFGEPTDSKVRWEKWMKSKPKDS